MVVATFTGFFEYLAELGILDSLLPFLLIFAIVFAILQKATIFGKDKKNINMVVALIIALAVVIPHISGLYPEGADVVNVMNVAIPQVSLVVVAIIMILLLIGIFAPEIQWPGGTVGGWVTVLAAIIVFYIFGNNLGWFGYRGEGLWLGWLGDSSVQAIVLIILVFGLVIWFITSDEKKER